MRIKRVYWNLRDSTKVELRKFCSFKCKRKKWKRECDWKLKDLNFRLNLEENQTWRKLNHWASLVVQWLEILLPVQGTQVLPLVWEDTTGLRAAKPVCHDYWPMPRASAPQQEAATVRSACSAVKRRPRPQQLEKARVPNKDPAQPKVKFLYLILPN